MKNSTTGTIVMLVALAIAGAGTAVAEEMSGELSAEQEAALESVGALQYPDSAYLTGDDEGATVLWFSSDDAPDKILEWYAAELDDWSEIDVNGTRILYKGAPGLDKSELSTVPYIFVRTTEESGVSSDSEITIRIPGAT